MKTKSHSKITFSQAVNGYLLAAQSRHLSQHTIDEYLNTFRKFQTSLDDDPPLITLSPADVQAFLAAQTVSKKTILNYHIGLSALWTWAANEGLAEQHILHQVESAKPEKRTIPFCARTGQALWRYLTLSQADLERSHKLASPVDHWRL